jgi:3-oxoacyl-[acyl-carrier protein] reductase
MPAGQEVTVDYGIKGELALILGGTRGLGLSCAEALAQAGVRVLVNGRDKAVGEAVAARLGNGAAYLQGDISKAEQRQALFKAASAVGPVSILVTNAGGPPPGQFLETTPESWHAAFETNVFAAVETMRVFLPGMIERRFGRIVNITSFVVKELYPNMAISNTMRIALTGAAATLAREVIEHGVTVNNILPGLMDTGALQRVFKDRAKRQGVSEDEVKKQMAASVPAKRLGTADDFGPACAFLCSRLAGYITGQNICIDGGLVKSLI